MFQKKCQTCKLYIPASQTCQIMIAPMQGKIKPTDYCAHHTETLYQCEICGGGLLEPIFATIDGVVHVYCAQCLNRI